LSAGSYEDKRVCAGSNLPKLTKVYRPDINLPLALGRDFSDLARRRPGGYQASDTGSQDKLFGQCSPPSTLPVSYQILATESPLWRDFRSSGRRFARI